MHYAKLRDNETAIQMTCLISIILYVYRFGEGEKKSPFINGMY